MSSIVTGEAVVLELRPASFAARGVGLLLDLLCYTALYIGGLIALLALIEHADPAAISALFLSWAVTAFVVVPVAVETLWRGKSVGKAAMGLRIVRDDGGSIRFRQALIRGLTGFLEIYLTFGSVAFITSLLNEKSQRLGDLLAGTYSLRERTVAARPGPLVMMPPPLVYWASLADIGRLPDGLGRRISQFMTQSSRMTPQSREMMASSLATEAAQWVAPPPPPGTPAEAFLAAVTAERRDRDYRRLVTVKAESDRIAARMAHLPYTN
ncbi:RDD family protein [Psychromicrobium xiongbiense]|uniref:RDD family protein n=1 Tax=Psychromicrobium xiongbiense TaxID=3051184 RepID=UPI0025522864|nr:RDD family protein [Psychromicrobium sp. YIM S02556]